MAYSSVNAITGPVERRKVKRSKPPPVTTVNATLGGAGVSRTERQARPGSSPAIVAAATGMSVKEARKARRRGQRAIERARTDPYTGPSARGLTTAERALADFKAGRDSDDDDEKDYTKFVNRRGEIEDFEDYAPTGIRIIRALTGDTPGATEPTLGELGNIALTLGSGGAGAALRAPAKAKAAAKVLKAEQGAKATTTAKTAAKTEKLKKAGTTAKAQTKAQKAKNTAKVGGEKAKARYSGPARKVRRKSRSERLTSKAVNPVTGTLAPSESVRGAVEGHGKALWEDPIQVLKTTERTALGMPAAVVADVVDLASGNFGDFAKSQTDYLATVGKLFEGDSEKAKDTILNDVGLIPLVTAGLGAHAGARAYRTVRPKQPSVPKPGRARQRDLKASQSPDPNTRAEAKRRLAKGDYPEGPRTSQNRRRRESERSSTTAEEEQGMATFESRETGKRKGKIGPRRTIEADTAKLAKNKIAPNVSDADIIRLAGDLALSGKEPNLRGILERERKDLRDPRKPIPDAAKDTRSVLDALIKEPKAIGRVQDLLDRFARAQGEQGIERARELDPDATGPTLSDEHVRYSGVMRNERLPGRDERIPVPLRGVTKVKEGPRVEQRIRQSSKQAQKRAKSLRQVAEELEAQGNLRRAESFRNRAGRNEARAIQQLEVVDRFRRAKSLDSRAARLEKKGDRVEVEGLRAEAERQRALGEDEQRQVAQEAVVAAKAKVAETGRREPIYFKQEDVTDPASSPNSGVPQSRKAAKEKFRSGDLAKRGMVDESALTLLLNLRTQRAALAERQRQRGFVDENFLDIDGDRLGTREEWAAHAEAGRVPDGYELAPIAEVAPATQRTPALRKEVERKRLNVQATDKGTVYAMVPRSSLKEFRAQAERAVGFARGLRTVGRIQGIAMLATSPAWFALQPLASSLVMAARNPNPAAWARASRTMVDTWRKASPRDRTTFNAMFGGNPADFLTVGDNVRGVSPYRTEDLRGSVELAFKSPGGRFVRAVGRNIMEGGPLIKANRRMEARMRELAAHLEMDRLAGLNGKGNPRLTPRLLEFATNTSDAMMTIYSHMNLLKGKSGAERVEFYARNPDKAQALQKNILDATGDWSSMTARERGLSGILTFYPFLRFSLRWLHYEFPKNNPVKAAIGLNLSQQNAQELEEMLGGPPGFFTGWGQAVTHVGDGKQLTDLARVAPGGNALVETTAGADELNLSTITRPLQPLIGTVVNALEGKDQFGNPKPDASKLELIGTGLTNINPITRPLRDKIIPPGEYAQLFRVIEGRDGSMDEGLNPLNAVLVDVHEAKETARASRLLTTAFAYDSDEKQDIPLGTPERKEMNIRKKASEKAWDELNQMLIDYGIRTKADEKKADAQYKRREYGAPATSSSSESTAGTAFDSTFGGGKTTSKSGSSAFEQVFGG